ncbi:MAG: sigma-70 family RNA polymerase sigma factor, partial [Hyphomicrobiales bacterium]|nr:sigma-70 family RNA polymerase sigma factor [Hyphomicrobiales bacterium]
ALPATPDPSEEPEAPETGEAIMLTAEREERVRRALAMLPHDQAEVVRLSFFGEKPQSEIASELGIPLGTVKSRVRLAFGRLRQILEDLK